MDRMIDNADRLAEIRERVGTMVHYRFGMAPWVTSGPVGRAYEVIATDQRVTGTLKDHVPVRGPSAYFTSYDDAEQYAHLVNDLIWLLGEYRRLAECVGRNI